ncbi:polypeptide deformylase [Rickettsia canadensis str. CA410]|uniref:Polypeptide deformylase n=1 Tax=Rickettsia canadensis str. CA410 TaxID=1105107 RepID=A0ABM5MTG3_RICCA
MVGLLKRIAVVELHENNKSSPINLEITYCSKETSTFIERALSFLGIEASIYYRSKAIKMKYLDYNNGTKQKLEAEGLSSKRDSA